MNGQYYIKKNNRYVPVNEPLAMDGLEEGAWLVTVDGNCKSIRQQLDPKMAELDAALFYLKEELARELYQKSQMRPKSRLMSKKEIKAWDAYKKIMGRDISAYFEYASFDEMASGACDRIKKIVLENNGDIVKIKEKYEIKKRSTCNAVTELEI